jgi:Predicted Zn-dependent peptidases
LLYHNYGSTNYPQEFQQYLQKNLSYEQLLKVLDEKKFQRIKRDSIGSYIFAQNSPEAIANQMAELYFYDIDYLNLLNLIDSIQRNDVLQVAEQFLKQDNYTYYNLLSDEE